MKIIRPYQTVEGALRALDNGGRFFNIFTSAGDDVVTSAELKKAAGVFSSDQAAYLFFAMALADLDEGDRREVESRLDPGLRNGLRLLGPKVVSPVEFSARRALKSCIIEGYPRRVEDHDVHGFMMMPIMVGNVTTFMMIPTHSVFQVYEIYATPARRGGPCKVMWPKGKWVSGKDERIRWGGVVKQENLTDKKSSPKKPFLEPQYYTPLG